MSKFYALFLASILLTSIASHAQQYPVPSEPNRPTSPETNYFARPLPTKWSPAESTSLQQMTSKPRKGTCQYTSNSELVALSTSQLLTYLKSTSDYECHARILWNYEETYSSVLFTNEKIQAVANELKTLAPTYDGTYTNGIYGLLCYIHIATYFDFYHKPIVELNQASWDAIIQASNSLSANTHLLDTNYAAANILEEFIINLDLPGVRSQPATIALVKKVMENMTVYNTWQSVSDPKLVAGYWRIFFLMFRGAQDVDYINAIKNDSTYIALWGSIATDTAIMNSPDFSFWLDNAILELSRVSTDTALKDDVLPYLAKVSETSPRLSKNWLNAVNAINDAGACATYNLCENKDTLQQELMNELFPNTYAYNDGKLIFRAKFDRAAADNLYYATQQTRAQLFRSIETDQPVAGDTNQRLTAIVFDSKATYDSYAGYLYGIPTNNGGMYLEQPAQFLTWDRPVTYSLSLEELFRHEYNHYLQGRFLIPGFWGQTSFYNNDRLTWYEEGSAELWCASTDFYGIRIKPSTINTLKSDYPNCPTLKEVLTSYYGMSNAIYYPYGNLIWFNWYNNYYGLIKRFTGLTRSNNITGFDALVDSLKNSTVAEAQWQSFLTDMKNGVIQPWQPTTNWMNDKELTIGTIDDIQSEFATISGISNTTVAKEANGLIRRFKISGALVGNTIVTNATDASIKINQALDSLQLVLKNNSIISNFDYTVGYFTNVSYASGIPRADFTILGALRDSTVSEAPFANFISDNNTCITGGNIQFTSTSTGYIKGYEWNFPGGTPSTSTAQNPIVQYNKAGNYAVTLKVTGKNSSITDTKTVTTYIKVYESSPTTYCAATFSNNYSWIADVKLAAIDNPNNTYTSTGHADYTLTHLTELIKDSAYPITIDLNYVNSPSIKIGVWIDLNQNGLFTDDSEEMILTSLQQQNQLENATITIPALANNGVTRMRIRATYDGTISPCGNNGYMGETEDYSVVIRSLITDTIKPSTPEGLVVNNVTATSCNLSWNAASDNAKLAGYVIYKNGVAYATVSDTVITITGLMASSGYSFTVKAKDSDGNYSDASQKIDVITLFSQASGGIYLSDLTETSSTIGWGTLQKDKSIGENPIKLNGITYVKGLGTHANSTQTYSLNAGYIRFLAEAGVDDEVGEGGASTVIFKVYKDNVLAYTSPVMTPSSANAMIDIDVTGTQVLKIEVTDAGDGMNSDHADWADARLIPKSTELLILSDTSLIVDASDNSQVSFTITSNTTWSLMSNQNWLSLDISSDSGNAIITATATANLTASTRSAEVTIAGNGISNQRVSITQLGITTEIMEQNNEYFSVYPNPATNQLKIRNEKLEMKNNEKCSVSICNTVGQEIYNSSLIIINSSLNIDVSQFIPGLYFISINNHVQKFIKQ